MKIRKRWRSGRSLCSTKIRKSEVREGGRFWMMGPNRKEKIKW
jgi:hypothetical protein